MKNLLSRKISAVAMTAVMLFVTVFSVSIFADAATEFSPRLTEPSRSNKYYHSDINVFYKFGYTMPNCTAYAFGRAYEILKKEPKLSHYDAKYWYQDNIDSKAYPYGQTPKLGAIACWKYSDGGHVAVVEKIENNKITFSNSAYGGEYFYLTTSSTSDKNFGGSSWWDFQGFIYIGDFSAKETEPQTTAPALSEGIYKTHVDTSLNMRSGAGTSYSRVTSIPNGVSLTVTQIKQNGGYTWGYTTYNGHTGWVALDYCVYVSPIPTTAPPTTTTPPTTTAPSTTTAPTTTEPVTEPTTQKQGLGVGDVNYDNSIDVMDATEIMKHLTQLVVFTDEQYEFADFNFSGSVDIADATAIQKYVVSCW